MDGFKIIDMAADKDSRFTSGGLILITGITESNLNDAITITESAKASENVTAGILSGNINPLNQNMRRLSEIVDAVIISPGKIEDPSRAITDSISDLITKTGFVNIDIEDLQEIFRDAGTVYYGTGTAKDSSTAAKTASEKFGNIPSAKRFLVNVTAGTEIMLSELSDAAQVIAMSADPQAQVI